MDTEFKNFSFGGDFKLQVDDSSYQEFCSPVLDETGATSIAVRPEQNSRKRKIDKDGFVTPATPDIPKTSSHYEDSCHDDEPPNYDLGSDIQGQDENPSGFGSVEDSTTQPTDFNCNDQHTGMYLGDAARLEETDSKPFTAGSLEDLLKEFGQEAKLLQTQWAETFRESEDFELLCPTRLDNYIEEAKGLESTLNRQKEVLFHRLQGIGKTLQA